MTTRGLRLNVLRVAGRGDTTMGGVSGVHDALTVVAYADLRRERHPRNDVTDALREIPDYMQVTEWGEDAPPVALVVDLIMGSRTRLRVIPLDPDSPGKAEYRAISDSDGHVMFGGNYVTAGDTRWNTFVENLTGLREPIPVHDRVEPWPRSVGGG